MQIHKAFYGVIQPAGLTTFIEQLANSLLCFIRLYLDNYWNPDILVNHFGTIFIKRLSLLDTLCRLWPPLGWSMTYFLICLNLLKQWKTLLGFSVKMPMAPWLFSAEDGSNAVQTFTWTVATCWTSAADSHLNLITSAKHNIRYFVLLLRQTLFG